MSTKDKRDADMDRLLRAVLKPASHGEASAGADIIPGACPDAGLLAAYVEGGVSAQERTELDGHFARCGRCQETLAVIGRDVPRQEVAAPGVRWFTWVSRPRLRWLVPITAIATVAVFFLATRSLIAPGGLTSDFEVTQMARATPPPPTLPPVEEKTEHDSAVPAPAKPDSATASRQEAGRRQANEVTGSKQVVGETPAPNPVGQGALEKQAASEAPADLGARGKADEKRSRPAAEPAAAQLAAAPAATEVPARTDAAPKMVAADAVREAPVTMARQEELRDLRAGLFVVAAPSGSVRWRFGQAGRIWRSADAGLTWHAQASGVSGDLFAGAAPSLATCWAVGAAGTVLLTQDGERWERRPFPLVVDLTGIEATNARAATVITRDGRRFETLDGGSTWTPR